MSRVRTPEAAVALAFSLAVAAGTGSCGDEPRAWVVPPAPLVVGEAPAGFPAGPLAATGPPDNLLTEERAQLGKRLFFDPRLSRSGDISCASCHDQKHAFADPRAVSVGVDGRTGRRNASALVNLAWGLTFFWDGRARSLEDQAGQPIENPLEMDLPLTSAVERVRSAPSYVQQFRVAYGTDPSEETLRKALASFVRTLVSGASPYDRFLAGDTDALDPAARHGEVLFFNEAGCFHCHPAGALTNEGFFNNGSYVDGGDIGRKDVTGRSGDLGKFKVPGLRNVAVTAPYMHDGSMATLEEVIEHYDRGGRGHDSTDPQIEPLGLSPEDKQDLAAFLRALTDDAFLVDARFRP